MQITPENAPIVVAAVGGQKEVDQRIVVPSIRSLVRNVYGGEITVPERQPDGSDQDGDHAADAGARHDREPRRAGAGDPRAGADRRHAAPASTSRRSGSANPRSRRNCCWPASASNSPGSCAPPISRSRSRRSSASRPSRRAPPPTGRTTSSPRKSRSRPAQLAQERRQAEGHAERLFLEEQAAGQTAQANVLGKDSVLQLQELKLVLDTARRASRNWSRTSSCRRSMSPAAGSKVRRRCWARS